MALERPKSTLPILFSVIIIDLIGFGIVLPILPFYAKEFDASPTELGLLLAIHAAFQFLFSPVWGRLSDRIGRRPVIIVTVAGTAAALLGLGLAPDIRWLFAARALSGLFGANISVATAYLADVTDESERTRWMGMIGASFGIGFVLGPAIGGLLSKYGHGAPMFFAAGLAAINCVYAMTKLREPERHEAREQVSLSLSESLRDRWVRQLCLMNFMFCFAVTQLETMFAYFMMDRFSYDAMQVAFILVGMAVVMGGIQGGGMKSLAKRYSDKTLLTSGLVLMALGFAAIPSMYSVSALLIPLALNAVGRAIAQPPLTSLISARADPSSRGTVMGAYQAAASLARVIGPITAGLLYGLYDGNPMYMAAAVLTATFGIALLLPDTLAKEPQPTP